MRTVHCAGDSTVTTLECMYSDDSNAQRVRSAREAANGAHRIGKRDAKEPTTVAKGQTLMEQDSARSCIHCTVSISAILPCDESIALSNSNIFEDALAIKDIRDEVASNIAHLIDR